MAEDHIRYDILAQEALRGVVRKVLTEVSRTGLPGDHHFFISFVTRAPGVRVSQRLLAQYDQEMTIVLQNQFWDLNVSETGFEVGLSFDGQNELLVIPFSAVKGFFDPSVQFGLQFEVADAPESSAGPTGTVSNVVPAASNESDEPEGDGPDEGGSGEKVVSLDSFRKK
ncbi:SspB family protein [Pelagibacterium montanilacus]|uniref:SspB family protein n=1 Tax=Pelagibacterium montanilacus TaxID=2185280 RepID=UPI000F8E62EF|nr:SspB family protein [Pelagibacterium montanilacus]